MHLYFFDLRRPVCTTTKEILLAHEGGVTRNSTDPACQTYAVWERAIGWRYLEMVLEAARIGLFEMRPVGSGAEMVKRQAKPLASGCGTA